LLKNEAKLTKAKSLRTKILRKIQIARKIVEANKDAKANKDISYTYALRPC